MVQFISVFIVAILFTACSAAPVKRGVETLQADISEIALHTAALDDAVTAFPEVGATLKDTEVCSRSHCGSERTRFDLLLDLASP
jgi:hypothetical protein